MRDTCVLRFRINLTFRLTVLTNPKLIWCDVNVSLRKNVVILADFVFEITLHFK